MKEKEKAKKSILITALCFVTAAGLMMALMPGIFADEPAWNLTFDKVSGNSALGVRGRTVDPKVTGYRAMQGIGFDTYSGEDGYVFMGNGDENKPDTEFSLSHFKMDKNGFCTKVYKRTYQEANVGHANDATVYRDGNGIKWLIFAPCGAYDDDNDTKATDGTKLNLGAIKLNGSGNPGEATVYSCNVSAVQDYFAGDDNKGNITGVSYMGKKFIDGKEYPVFLIMNAKEIYEVYLTQSGNKFTFKPTKVSGRIKKPELPSGDEADTQGICYHNNYVYITGEGKGAKAAEMVVARISLDTLFEVGRSDYAKMEEYRADMKTDKVTKHGPEAVFFTSLNEKSHLNIGVNRQVTGIGDDDEIERTRAKF